MAVFRVRNCKIHCSLLKIYFTGIFISICLSGAIGQTYWAKFQGGPNVDETLGVTGDASGNTFTTGYFSSTAQVNGTSLSVNGLTDIFVSKVGVNGTTLWSKAVGGPQSDRGLGIATDPSGNVLVCGFFTGTANFGNGIVLSANGGSQDAFVAKFNTQGEIIWARAGGSSGNSDRANAVATDENGNVFITGQFTGTASFGSFALNSTNNTNDIFIVKYGSDGTELWARQGSGDALNRGLAITTDIEGAVYASGQFSGNITFQNTYTNTILNALFLVKFTTAGDEAWFRYAGGSSQSIGYGLTNNGSNIFLTGDCGSSLTFFGGTGTPVINSAFTNAVFIASYNSSGAYQWGISQGSSTAVSARAISHHNGEVGVTGWYECTFNSLSDAYGESNFMNIGFQDIYVMRYSATGTFLWARNFGSVTDDVAAGIHILPDNLEAIAGTFTTQMVIPIRNSLNTSGLIPITQSPNPGLTYCGDPNYGEFSILNGSADADGFLIKVIDLQRQPYDFFHREVSGACDLSIPEACIIYPGDVFTAECQTEVIGCAPYSISATNFGNFGSNGVGYTYTGQWTPTSTGINKVITAPGNVSAILQSTDGCYQHNVSAFADVFPAPSAPLMSDNAVVNTLANNTFPVFLCPGDSVQIWADYPDGLAYGWSGSNVTADMVLLDTLNVSLPGAYQINIENEYGCTGSNFILVLYENVPPDTLDPFISFNLPNDTLTICSGDGGLVFAYDAITMEGVDPEGLSFVWNISPDGFIGGSTAGSFGVPGEGWYVIDLEITTLDNPCFEVNDTYYASDSVYVQISPLPSVFLNASGPAATCPGDTLVFYMETDGELSYDFTPIEVFGDSLYVSGAGQYVITATQSNEFGCTVISTVQIDIVDVSTPEIEINSEFSLICPGDSVELVTDAPGQITWQGPSGNIGAGESIFVNEAGLYFAEVTFYAGCALVSNTLQISEYATPFLSSSNAVLCPGDTVVISIISTAAGSIEWQAPLSGNDTLQVITEPGIYTAIVTGCGITTEISIVVELSTSELEISIPNLTPTCFGDSIFVIATEGMDEYNWSPFGQGSSNYFFTNGNIQVEAVDTNGCELTSNILSISFEPLPPAPVFDFELVCEGEFQVVSIFQDFGISWVDGLDGSLLSSAENFAIGKFNTDTTLYAFLSSEFCEGPLDSIFISPKPYPEEPLAISNAPVCIGENILFEVLNAGAGVNYVWNTPTGGAMMGTGITFPAGSMDDEGIYSVTASLAGCGIEPVEISVSLFVPRQVALPPDTALCLGVTYALRPDTIFNNYLWQDGGTDSVYFPTISGTYILMATDFNGCLTMAFSDLFIVDCEIAIPNIFTPNGDGLNDLWIVGSELPSYFRTEVYNRWGQLVFQSIDQNVHWDGIHYKSGEFCPEGVYFYVVDAANYFGTRFQQTGTVTLIRQSGL